MRLAEIWLMTWCVDDVLKHMLSGVRILPRSMSSLVVPGWLDGAGGGVATGGEEFGSGGGFPLSTSVHRESVMKLVHRAFTCRVILSLPGLA